MGSHARRNGRAKEMYDPTFDISHLLVIYTVTHLSTNYGNEL